MGIESWTDVEYAQAAIDMLPGTVEEIAELMEIHGVKGQRNSNLRCPVAQWLNRWMDNNASVGLFEAGPWQRPRERVTLPTTVRAFIDQFDAGLVSL